MATLPTDICCYWFVEPYGARYNKWTCVILPKVTLSCKVTLSLSDIMGDILILSWSYFVTIWSSHTSLAPSIFFSLRADVPHRPYSHYSFLHQLLIPVEWECDDMTCVRLAAQITLSLSSHYSTMLAASNAKLKVIFGFFWCSLCWNRMFAKCVGM